MALNNYTKSSRFTNITTPPPENGVTDIPEVTVTRNGETAAQRNERRYRDYQAQSDERDRLVSEEDKRSAMSRKDIENYELAVEEYNRVNKDADFETDQRVKKDFSMFAGGGKKVGPDALKKYNERQRKEGKPVATNLYRPGSFKDDTEFLEAMKPKGTRRGSIYQVDIKRPSKYKPKTYPEIDLPDYESEPVDRMELMPGDLKTRRQRARNIELSDQSGPEYSDPRKPSRGKMDVFKGDKIKYAQKATRDNNTGTKGLGYRTEERLAKATYGRGLEGTNMEGLSERKSDAKYDRRRALKTGNISAAMDAGREVRDVSKAERYRKAAMGKSGARMSGDIDRPGALKYFTPERMEGFRDSKDNPLNRNRRS